MPPYSNSAANIPLWTYNNIYDNSLYSADLKHLTENDVKHTFQRKMYQIWLDFC